MEIKKIVQTQFEHVRLFYCPKHLNKLYIVQFQLIADLVTRACVPPLSHTENTVLISEVNGDVCWISLN